MLRIEMQDLNTATYPGWLSVIGTAPAVRINRVGEKSASLRSAEFQLRRVGCGTVTA
jgi:hypothetical protein